VLKLGTCVHTYIHFIVVVYVEAELYICVQLEDSILMIVG